MGHGRKVSCALCRRDKETKETGPLLTKDQVTAHQKCLLFSSGIFCRNSPQYDDLFGFSVDDVLNEVKRGSKLICSQCKKKGATAGCEVKRCRKSYHYPCAVQEGAEVVEDLEREIYGLYCLKHRQHQQEKSSAVNGRASSITKPRTSKNPSETGPSKFCLTCEKAEGNISLESLSNRVLISDCDKHASKPQKRNIKGDSTAARPSACSSDSNSSSSTKRSHTKMQSSSSDKQQEPSSKRTPDYCWILTDDSSEPDEPDPDMAPLSPLESDIDGSVHSQVEFQSTSHRNNNNSTESTSGHQVEDKSKDGNRDDDETDVESESLLPPVRRSAEDQPCLTSMSRPESRSVHSPDPHTAGPSVPQQSSTSPPPSPNHSKPCSVTRRAISPAPPETVSPPAALPSDPVPSIDSTSFWKSCNAARCTQAIFTDFINEINNISSRIQSDQASQEDYDVAIRVMEASGKLAAHVTKQQKELQREQAELQKAAAAMKEIVSALKR